MNPKDTYLNATSVLAGRKAEVTDEQAVGAVRAVMWRVDHDELDRPGALQVLDMLGLVGDQQ